MCCKYGTYFPFNLLLGSVPVTVGHDLIGPKGRGRRVPGPHRADRSNLQNLGNLYLGIPVRAKELNGVQDYFRVGPEDPSTSPALADSFSRSGTWQVTRCRPVRSVSLLTDLDNGSRIRDRALGLDIQTRERGAGAVQGVAAGFLKRGTTPTYLRRASARTVAR